MHGTHIRKILVKPKLATEWTIWTAEPWQKLYWENNVENHSCKYLTQQHWLSWQNLLSETQQAFMSFCQGLKSDSSVLIHYTFFANSYSVGNVEMALISISVWYQTYMWVRDLFFCEFVD